MPVTKKDWPMYVPNLTEVDRANFKSMAMRCARGIRACATDDQYCELVDRIVEAMAFVSGKIAVNK